MTMYDPSEVKKLLELLKQQREEIAKLHEELVAANEQTGLRHSGYLEMKARAEQAEAKLAVYEGKTFSCRFCEEKANRLAEVMEQKVHFEDSWKFMCQESKKWEDEFSAANSQIEKAKEIIKQLAGIDPVYGPTRCVEPRKNPLDMDEKAVYTSRRICGLCRERSEHQGENVCHKKTCPWIGGQERCKSCSLHRPG